MPITFALGDIIDFETIPIGTAVTTQYPSVTFSGTVDHENRVMADFDFGTGKYIITATIDGEVDGVNSTTLEFTDPVMGLTFLVLGDDSAGLHAMVDVYEDDVFVIAVPIFVDGIFSSTDVVDLTKFSNVTKIIMWDISDPGGLAWDRFVFEPMPDTCPADVNDDGEVDVMDLLLISAAQETAESGGDDGIVNILDLLMVIGMWGTCAYTASSVIDGYKYLLA